MYIQNDQTPPTNNGTVNANLPNIQITYNEASASAPNPVVLISPEDNAQNIATTTSLNWASGGNYPTGYRLWFGADNPPTNIIDSLDVGIVTGKQIGRAHV